MESKELITEQKPVTESIITEEANQQQYNEAAEQLADPKAALDAYLNDEKVKTNLRMWAEHLEKAYGRKWFTVQETRKKFNVDAPRMSQILEFLILQGFAHRRVYGTTASYKITPTLSEKIELLMLQVADFENKKQLLLKEVERLKADLEKQQSKQSTSDTTSKG